MQSLALRTSSGGQCLLFEEMCLGGKVISWAALEFCCYHGVLPCLKSLPTARELQLLGKAAGAGEAKVSTTEKMSCCFVRVGSAKNAEQSWKRWAGACKGGEWPLTQPAGNS